MRNLKASEIIEAMEVFSEKCKKLDNMRESFLNTLLKSLLQRIIEQEKWLGDRRMKDTIDNTPKVSRIQFIYNNGDIQEMLASDSDEMSRYTTMCELLTQEYIDDIALYYTDKYGGCGGMSTSSKVRQKALEILIKQLENNDI